MLNKSVIIASTATVLTLGLSVLPTDTHAFALNSASVPPQDKSLSEPTGETGNARASSALQFDRSGADRASVHLQILQQVTPRGHDLPATKKTVAEDKKSQAKSAASS